jgi:hypothetical protein
MFGFVVALAVGVIAFWLTADAIYKPRPAKPVPPKPVTISDVWASIASAQRTLDESRKMIYGGS